jgi:threonine aldolase
MCSKRGGKLLREVETNMVWLDLREAGVEEAEWNAAGRRHGVRLDGKRVVVHHQICDEAIKWLSRAMDDVFDARCVPQGEQSDGTASFGCRSSRF